MKGTAVGASPCENTYMNLEEAMAKESWSLAATLLSQDGLSLPALLLWRDSDDAVKLCRVASSTGGADLAHDILEAAQSFDFDHAILLSRSFVALATSHPPSIASTPKPGTHRFGVSLTYGSRVGSRSMHFAEIVENCGVFTLGDPTSLPSVATPLDFVFRSTASIH